MGGGGQAETGSTTTELPKWMQDRYGEVFDKEDDLYDWAMQIAGGMDPREILGPSDMEKLGLEEAMKGLETGEHFLDSAGDFTGVDTALGGMYDMAGQAGDMADFRTDRIGDKTLDEMRAGYESDYTDDVVDTTLAGQDRQRERERLAAQLQASATGGTSNTRSAIGQAVSDQIYGMDRAATEAGLRDDAFRTASEFGQREAELGQSEDQMNYDFLRGGTEAGQSIWGDILSGEEGRRGSLEGLSSAWAGLGTTKGGLLSNFGETARSLEQGQADADRTHDMDMATWLSSILGQNKSQGPSGIGTTTEMAATPSMGQQMLGIGTTLLGGWLSDENAKEEISDAGGGALDQIASLDVKEYSYKRDAPGHRDDRHKGLIAQDVESKIPGSVYTGGDGLRRIDPFVVAATIVQAVDELDAKQRPHSRWQKSAGVAA